MLQDKISGAGYSEFECTYIFNMDFPKKRASTTITHSLPWDKLILYEFLKS